MSKVQNIGWYKIVINHGPGHQSKTTLYRYSTLDYIHGELENSNLSNPVFKIKKISKLPEDIKQQNIEKQKSIIKTAKEMLKILNLK